LPIICAGREELQPLYCGQRRMNRRKRRKRRGANAECRMRNGGRRN